MNIFGKTTPSVVALCERLQDVAGSIRWGGFKIAEGFNGQCNLYNGLQQLTKFRQATLPTIEFTADLNIARQWVAAGSIVLGRRTNHTQGRDIILPNNRHWEYRDYWTKYEPAIEEWRFHIFKGLSIGRGRKANMHTPYGETHPIIRSRRRGWHIDHDSEPPKGIRKIAKDAVKTLGYDFGAVDIICTAPDTFKVLEVNARPALRDEYTLSAYEKAIRNATRTGVHV